MAGARLRGAQSYRGAAATARGTRTPPAAGQGAEGLEVSDWGSAAQPLGGPTKGARRRSAGG